MRSLRDEPIAVARGMIEDRDACPLAISIPVKVIWAAIMATGDIQEIGRWLVLANVLNIPPGDIAAHIHDNASSRFIGSRQIPRR